MASASEDLKERLARAGWSVTELRENTLTVEGKVRDATIGLVSRGPLLGTFTRYGEDVDSALADLMVGSYRATRRVGATTFGVTVRDTGRALEELSHLEPLMKGLDFSAALALVEARGFTVDRQASCEDTYDGYAWIICARSPSEQLEVWVRFILFDQVEEPSPGGYLSHDRAEMRIPGVSLTVTLDSLTMSRELLDVLGARASTARRAGA